MPPTLADKGRALVKGTEEEDDIDSAGEGVPVLGTFLARADRRGCDEEAFPTSLSLWINEGATVVVVVVVVGADVVVVVVVVVDEVVVDDVVVVVGVEAPGVAGAVVGAVSTNKGASSTGALVPIHGNLVVVVVVVVVVVAAAVVVDAAGAIVEDVVAKRGG